MPVTARLVRPKLGIYNSIQVSIMANRYQTRLESDTTLGPEPRHSAAGDGPSKQQLCSAVPTWIIFIPIICAYMKSVYNFRQFEISRQDRQSFLFSTYAGTG